MTPDDVEAEIRSLWVNEEQTQARVRDLEKRLDTLQSPFRKRLWWWLYEGWPWHDLNAPQRQHRPWFRGRR